MLRQVSSLASKVGRMLRVSRDFLRDGDLTSAVNVSCCAVIWAAKFLLLHELSDKMSIRDADVPDGFRAALVETELVEKHYGEILDSVQIVICEKGNTGKYSRETAVNIVNDADRFVLMAHQRILRASLQELLDERDRIRKSIRTKSMAALVEWSTGAEVARGRAEAAMESAVQMLEVVAQSLTLPLDKSLAEQIIRHATVDTIAGMIELMMEDRHSNLREVAEAAGALPLGSSKLLGGAEYNPLTL